MPSWLGAMGRWCAIFALGFLFVPALALSWILNLLNVGPLGIAEACQRAIVRLQERDRIERAARLSRKWGV